MRHIFHSISSLLIFKLKSIYYVKMDMLMSLLCNYSISCRNDYICRSIRQLLSLWKTAWSSPFVFLVYFIKQRIRFFFIVCFLESVFKYSFQSQRKARSKNVQNTTKLHSFHMLAKYCSKFSKPGFNNIWTENVQMFKLILEKAEEPENKLPTSFGSSKKQESSSKTSTSALLTMPKPLTV